jgi:hypothetical protein
MPCGLYWRCSVSTASSVSICTRIWVECTARVNAKEISSPSGHTKQLFDNSTKAIFVLENIFCGQNLIQTFFFLKPGFVF